jgi:hypothetical protein
VRFEERFPGRLPIVSSIAKTKHLAWRDALQFNYSSSSAKMWGSDLRTIANESERSLIGGSNPDDQIASLQILGD